MSLEIRAPGRFVPEVAITFGPEGEDAIPVDPANPLPIRSIVPPAEGAALSGTLSATGQSDPFEPELGRPVILTLSGTWEGTVQLLRSVDAGTSKLPLTYANGVPRAVWTTNINAPVVEEAVAGATYYLDFTRISGTLSFRLEQ